MWANSSSESWRSRSGLSWKTLMLAANTVLPLTRRPVVVRGHPGYIPGFLVWRRILRRVFRILLAARNIAHSSSLSAVSFTGSLFSSRASLTGLCLVIVYFSVLLGNISYIFNLCRRGWLTSLGWYRIHVRIYVSVPLIRTCVDGELCGRN